MEKTNHERIIIAGGGTGGHIYPAVAIAREILKINPKVEIHFVGTPAGLENKIIPREGFNLHHIHVGKLNYSGGFFAKIKTIVKLPWNLVECASLLWELKPNFVLGVGGYASGPFVLMAAILGFKTALWEPNAYPGMTNRLLSRFVKRSFIVFPEAKSFLKSQLVERLGLPVREQVEKVAMMGKVPKVPFKVLAFGGSQGARAINEALAEMLAKNDPELKDFEFVHQTGTADFEKVKSKVTNSKVQILEYLFDIETHYQWCDLVVCRAGASTVAEVAACGKPAIFIPLPSAADDHQSKNAKSLVDQGAAVLLEQKNLTAAHLKAELLRLKNSPDLCIQMSQNLKKFYQPQAAKSVAQKILNEGSYEVQQQI
ncbi:MAG: undecaprenyldiphospho-muramoylpentapeptide beta-N-acetylglucosaminyltransferase [Bdellovibrionota bacterium]